jgi:hypothetical protein
MNRRRVLALSLTLGMGLTLAPHDSAAEEIVVPVSLQVELLAKVAAYDRNFAARATDPVRVLVLTKPHDAQSIRVGVKIQSALNDLSDFVGLGVVATIGVFTTASDLAAACKAEKYAVVYLTPGFDNDIAAIAAALRGVSVLTVSTIPAYVPRGIVLGFDSASGKSKLLVNLTQARLQNIAFKAEILKLMKVFE